MARKGQYKVDEVYGIVRGGVPLTYVSRPQVDDRFLNETHRDQHIVVYGTSKQGKSSLLRVGLKEDDYVVVQCATNWTREKLYSSILKEIGVTFVESTTRARATTGEVGSSVGAEAQMPFVAKLTTRLQAKYGKTHTDTVVERTIPLDLSSAIDVIQLLAEIGFDRFIVVEDFHYLPTEVQREFASDLKAFYERLTAVSFIIVGVWLEANRLIVYNGDLAGRLTSIPADTWTMAELEDVVKSGEPFLNVSFSDDVRSQLTKRCQFNVGMLQEALRQMCLSRGIYATAENTVEFNDLAEVDRAYEYVAEQLATRYANFINKFSEGLRDQALHMYKWIMHAVIHASSEDRRAGLKTMDVVRHVQANHPLGERIYQNSVMQALSNVAKIQSHANITPIIFDYDDTHKRLTIVDNGFLVYLDSTPAEHAAGFLASFSNENER